MFLHLATSHIRQDCEVVDILSGSTRKKLYDIKKVKSDLKGVRTELKVKEDADCKETLLSNGSRGADTLAKKYAVRNDIPLIEFLPEYDRYGRRAPLMRNIQIVDNCDFLLAFWNGRSPGTRFTIDYAVKRGVPYKVVSII